VLPALDALRARGHRMAVVTNGMSDLQWLKLSLAGLEPYFDAFVASSAVGIGKPDPRVFEVALVRVGAQAADAVMIGDNPIRDIAGACRTGIRTVWVDRDGGDDCGVEPDLRITSLAELQPGAVRPILSR
jgi:HAD superfamily hydrolase (TIGR01509 family)